MPSSSGYTYVVISIAAAAMGVAYGLWNSNKNTATKKSKDQINKSPDWTSTLVRLKKFKGNLEIEIKQLDEDCTSLGSKIDSATMMAEKGRDPEDPRCMKAVQLNISGVCEMEVKECYDPRQLPHAALSVSSQPLHSNFPKDSAKDEELKLDHSTFYENWFDVQEGHSRKSAGVTGEENLEPVSLDIEPNNGIGISGETQHSTFMLEHKKQLLEESTHIEDQLKENKVRQTKLLQENKEYKNLKSSLSKEIQELQLLKKKLEEQVSQLKGNPRQTRPVNLYSGSTPTFPQASNTIRPRHRKYVSIDPAANRKSHHKRDSLSQRLKNIREHPFVRNLERTTSIRPLNSQHTSSRINEEPSEGKQPSFINKSKSQESVQSSSMEEKSRRHTIDGLSGELHFNSNAIVLPEIEKNQRKSVDSSEWNVTSIFLT